MTSVLDKFSSGDIVCLIGSSRFKNEFHRIGELLEKRGVLPLMMSFFQHADRREVSEEERETLRRVDRLRLSLADRVLVLNCLHPFCLACNQPCNLEWEMSECCAESAEMRPYTGDDTRFEIEQARKMGKLVLWLNGERV